jgi:hypothetical protein
MSTLIIHPSAAKKEVESNRSLRAHFFSSYEGMVFTPAPFNYDLNMKIKKKD